MHGESLHTFDDTTRRTSPILRWLRLSLLLLLLAVPALGALISFVHVLRDNMGVEGLGGVVSVDASADGLQVYAAGGDDNALAVFNRDATLGTLSFVEVHEDEVGGVFGLLGASGVAASPDGRHVYVTAAVDDTLAVFHRDATRDDLTFIAAQAKENNVGGVIGLDGASSVVVSPDDEQIFVTGHVDDALAVFRRDATNDDLTFVEAELDGFGGVDGLDGASAVAVSPDGEHVYVASDVDDSVAVFARDAMSGTVAWASKVTDGVAGVDGLDGASAVAVSPDGSHVYVAGRADNAVAAFERDPTTGALSFVAAYRDGVNGVDGIAGASAVALRSAGDRVLVAGANDDAVAIFRRDPTTGELGFLKSVRDGVDGVDGLAGARSIAIADDDVFVAGHDENAIAVFHLGLCEGDDAAGDSDGDAFCDDVDLCQGDDLLGDADSDGLCDDLDVCPGFDDTIDGDGDGVPDGCDLCTGNDATGDDDNDGVCNDSDICPGSSDAFDSDGDGVPNGCDLCLGDDDTGDSDGDDVCDDTDVCSGFDDAQDADGDGVPDGCDLCAGDDATGDTDSDGVCNDADLCLGDDVTGDTDSDGVCDGADVCAGFDDTADADADGVPDGCDVCTGEDTAGDFDGDGLCADVDCDDSDASNACEVFDDGFESGDASAWSAAVS